MRLRVAGGAGYILGWHARRDPREMITDAWQARQTRFTQGREREE
jgi:hypothetical protein